MCGLGPRAPTDRTGDCDVRQSSAGPAKSTAYYSGTCCKPSSSQSEYETDPCRYSDPKQQLKVARGEAGGLMHGRLSRAVTKLPILVMPAVGHLGMSLLVDVVHPYLRVTWGGVSGCRPKPTCML